MSDAPRFTPVPGFAMPPADVLRQIAAHNAASEEPRKPFCGFCESYHAVGQHEVRGRVLAAVLAEVARPPAGIRRPPPKSREEALVQSAGAAIRALIRLKAGGA